MQFIGAQSGVNNLTITTHQAGDLLLAWAYRDGSTSASTIPSGWRAINSTGANTNHAHVCYRYATGAGTASGTWTSATSLIIAVFRGAVLGAVAVNGASSNTVNYPALTMQNSIGTSVVIGFAGHRSTNTSLQTPPTGMTNQINALDGTDHAVMHLSAPRTGWSSTNVSVGGSSSGYRSATVEIKDADDTKIQFIGAATGAASATLPTHQAGDLLIAFTYRDGSTTAPTTVANWTSINDSGGNTNSARLAWRIAPGSGTASGTWTNATSSIFAVYRNAAVGASAVGGASSATVTYPSVTLGQGNGTSWVVSFAGHREPNNDLTIPPLPSIFRTSRVNGTTDEVSHHDTNGGIVAFGAQAVAGGGTASGFRAYSLEIVPSSPGMTPSGSGFTNTLAATTHLKVSGSGFQTGVGTGGTGSVQMVAGEIKTFS